MTILKRALFRYGAIVPVAAAIGGALDHDRSYPLVVGMALLYPLLALYLAARDARDARGKMR